MQAEQFCDIQDAVTKFVNSCTHATRDNDMLCHILGKENTTTIVMKITKNSVVQVTIQLYFL